MSTITEDILKQSVENSNISKIKEIINTYMINESDAFSKSITDILSIQQNSFDDNISLKELTINHQINDIKFHFTNNNPDIQTPRTKALQTWEGTVTEVGENCFSATLYDLSDNSPEEGN